MISFIVVSYKDRDYVIRHIKSIKSYVEGKDYEVIVVDNGFDNELEKELKSTFNKVRYYRLEENRGYGKAVNFGVSKAKGELICIANADTEFVSLNLEEIYDKMIKDKNLGLIGPKLILPSGNTQISWGLKPTIINEFLTKVYNFLYKHNALNKIIRKKTKREFYAEWLTGACFFIKLNVWEEIN